MRDQKNTDISIGEFPNMDFDVANTNRLMTKNIILRVLRGEWSATTPWESKMLREYRASGQSLTKFMKRFQK
tara:strand:- start:4995 stop:5210 length:216 start_codon:yes stop_codon:yes gene_type:complete